MLRTLSAASGLWRLVLVAVAQARASAEQPTNSDLAAAIVGELGIRSLGAPVAELAYAVIRYGTALADKENLTSTNSLVGGYAEMLMQRTFVEQFFDKAGHSRWFAQWFHFHLALALDQAPLRAAWVKQLDERQRTVVRNLGAVSYPRREVLGKLGRLAM